MIKEFQGKYRFLSNFFPSPVMWNNIEYPTVEHAYQAAKTLDVDKREIIRLQPTPGQAKRIGRVIPLREDWNEVKLKIMEYLVKQKFTRHENLKEQLLATGDEKLAEGNSWNDTYWGVCRGVGKNYLGIILMKVREELKQS